MYETVRARVWLSISLGANAALLALWWQARNSTEPSTGSSLAALHSPPSPPIIRTNVVIRRQNFVWNEIESSDYATYIANLRAIGCPEATIRDIIVADINQLFARRRATEVTTPQQHWWKSDPDPEVARNAAGQFQALDRERRALLTRLLGPAWESADYPYPEAPSDQPLDGPVLGSLPPAVKARVRQIQQESQARLLDYLEDRASNNRDPDPLELNRLRQQTREALARVLEAGALEEYLLRYSTTAANLRTQLRGLSTAPEEFRSLFRSLDRIENQLQAIAGVDGVSARRRAELEEQRDHALFQVLGPDRHQEFQLNQEPLYRQAKEVVEQTGVSPDKLLPLAAIYRLTELEEQRIRLDQTLTAEETLDRLQAARQAQQDSLRRLLGETAFQKYLEQTPP